MYALFEKGKVESMTEEKHSEKEKDKEPRTAEQEEEWQQHLECFINIFYIM